MADKELIITEKVDYTGLLDFSAFYSFAHSWLKNEQYGVDEQKYSEKVSGSKRDITIEWTATNRFSDYFKIEQRIRFLIFGLTDVEVEVDKERKKMNQGKVEATIKGILVRDPDGKWEKSPFSRFTREIYNKYILPSRVNDMKEFIKSDVQTFKEELKIFLELTGKR